jgi:hypothetical protein
VNENFQTPFRTGALEDTVPQAAPEVQQAAQEISQGSEFANYNDVLGQRESGGEYNIENQIGFIGKYQWGSPALQDLGMVKSGIGNSNKKLNDDGNWTGKFGIKSKEDFLSNPEAQEKVMVEWNKMLDRRIDQRGMDKFVGKTMNGVFITREGLRAATHLLGTGAVNQMLKSGNLGTKRDANGVTALEYINLFN